MADKYYHIDDCTLFCRDVGSGTIVVLLHGFGEDSHIFDEQIAFLADHCRVIAFDLPGSGLSSTDDLSICASIERMANCIASCMQLITDQPFVLLGHSMGGYITLAFAEKYPDHLKAFGLIHATAFADREEKKETRRKSIDFIASQGAAAFLEMAVPGLFSETFQRQFPERIKVLIDDGKAFSKAILINYYKAMIARPDRSGVLSGSKLPVLFIIGTVDKAAPMEDMLQQVKLPNIAYFHILEDVGHMGMWEATEKLNSFILKFIKDIE